MRKVFFSALALALISGSSLNANSSNIKPEDMDFNRIDCQLIVEHVMEYVDDLEYNNDQVTCAMNVAYARCDRL